MRGTPTPTWTEGTPSYTDSTYSGDGELNHACLSVNVNFVRKLTELNVIETKMATLHLTDFDNLIILESC